MTRLRLRVAERLKGAQNTYAMLTTFNEVDMTGLMEMRNEYKVSAELLLWTVFCVYLRCPFGGCCDHV
jgi:pyruvate/2-oxoglutarate dehydrogenase complex dihydrolipoamide acyltransferase (E2) component